MSETKIHVVADKTNPACTFNWYKKIDRDTENNNIVAKATPALMNKIQQKVPQVVSGEKIIRDYCARIGVTVADTDFNYKGTVAVAAADKTPVAVAVPDALMLQAQPYIDSLTKSIGTAFAENRPPTGELVWTQIMAVVPQDLQNTVLKAVAPAHYEKIHAVAPVPTFNL